MTAKGNDWVWEETPDGTTNIEPGTREYMMAMVEGRHPSLVAVMKHFAWAHLPRGLQPYSANCADLAIRMCSMITDDPELVLGLHKLLEAKDCFVRAAL